LDKLPDNVIKFNTLKANYRKEKHCTCYDWGYPEDKWPRYEIDTTNREVFCKECGNVVDAFDAMLMLTERGKRLEDEISGLYEQAVEISKYKPWLLVVREIERNVRGGEMIPTCPHCHKGILLEEIKGYTNKQMELERRKFNSEK